MINGFDAGFLDDLSGLVDASALADIGGVLDNLNADALSQLGSAFIERWGISPAELMIYTEPLMEPWI